MPSSFTHAIVAVALSRGYTTRKLPLRFWFLAVGCSLAPDMDVICTRFGISYTDMLGHRGLTHSILFAVILSALLIAIAFRKPVEGISRYSLWALLFVATMSHSVLDAMVDGTLGVALLAPFSSQRFFLPFRPIVSSPVGWEFFSSAGVVVLMNELAWIWLPSILIICAPMLRRRLGVSKRRDEQAASSENVTPRNAPTAKP
jgi:inner membrane protein